MNGMRLMNPNEPEDKDFLREKYFKSVGMEESKQEQTKTSTLYKTQHCNNIDESPPPPNNFLASSNNLVNYANVPLPSAFNIKHNEDEQESFDYYNTGAQFNYYNNTPLNTYYNVKQVRNDTTFLPIESTNNTLIGQNGHKKRPSPIFGASPTPLLNERHKVGFTHFRICNLLGRSIDSDIPVPPRQYTVVGNTKVGFPQFRQLKNMFIDPVSGITLQAGQRVRVTGPSTEPPRGRLRVSHQCGNELHSIDVPHYHFLRLSELDISNEFKQ